MDKGIRVNVNNKFREMLPEREKLGNTEFRRGVMNYAMKEFGITLASAATHYNHAFLAVKTATPELVQGLGRPDDKKGGRKAKPKAVEVAADANDAGETGVEQTVFRVLKKKDNTEVAKDLSFEAAKAMVEAAVKGKKAKLYWV